MKLDHLKRREFITLVAGAAAWPFAAGAQQPATPVVGFINPASPGELANRVKAFHNGLAELGFVEGRNVMIEYRWAEGRYDQLSALANDLVRRGVAAIAATGGIASVRAARSATAEVPIVFTTGSDPVEAGLVMSLNRPGGNVTGAGLMSTNLVAKRIEILRELIPNAKSIAVLGNAGNPSAKFEIDEAQNGARLLGLNIHIERADGKADFERAFTSIVQQRADALLVTTDPFFESLHGRIVGLAARHAIPTIYAQRQYALDGGLISYGASITDLYRQAGVYVGRILKGEKPADLPVTQPSKFEFVVNMRTAKVLRLDVPASILLRADEVIE
jgi:putative tryptophan/tyrosine transport system substrate-binding protein